MSNSYGIPPEIEKKIRDDDKKERTIAIVDFGNVEKWKNSLGWIVGIQELGKLVKHFSLGKKFLRRFFGTGSTFCH